MHEQPVAAIVYLDIDDEITSAASRIRGVSERRLALVLPAGSRVSTSRINFRLLAREATSHGRVLAIVTPEASSRALAASAGLPTFGSVAEYEATLEDSGPEVAGEDRGAPQAAPRTLEAEPGSPAAEPEHSAPEPAHPPTDRKSTRLNSSHIQKSRMPSSA